MPMLNGSKLVVLGLMMALALASFVGVQAEQDGISNVSSGCVCHSGSADTSVTVAVAGLPAEYIDGNQYTLTITVSGGPDAHSNGENAQGGFNLVASDGSFEPVDDNVQVENGEATHTLAGNDQREWTVEWTAPASGEVTFTAYANSVDGNGDTGGDAWNKVDYTVAGPNSGGSETSNDTPGFTAVFSIIALAGAGFVLSRRN